MVSLRGIGRRAGQILLAAAVLALVGTDVLGAAERVSIGVLINDKEREAEYYQGALEQLRAAGFGEDRARYTVHVANVDRALMAKAAEEFAATRLTLILVFGSTTTAAVVKRNRETPVVFVGTYDPEKLGVVEKGAEAVSNVTGVSNKLPMEVLVNTLRRAVPFKRLGIVYSQLDRRSAPARRAEQMKALQGPHGFVAVEGEVKRREEALTVMKRLIEKENVDALFIAGGTEITPREEEIVAYANQRKIPTINHDPGNIEKGYLLAVGVDEMKLGRRAGEMAVQILKGERPANIPVETAKSFMIVVNLKTASLINLKVPVDLLQAANRVIH